MLRPTNEPSKEVEKQRASRIHSFLRAELGARGMGGRRLSWREGNEKGEESLEGAS